jgi:hypothetical protein
MSLSLNFAAKGSIISQLHLLSYSPLFRRNSLYDPGSTMAKEFHESLHQRGRALEEAFFAERDRQLLETLRRRLSMEEAQKVLAAATGVMDAIALPELTGVAAPQFLAILGIYPMAHLAWCDGDVSADERKAILSAASGMGIEMGSTVHQLLERWLETRPADQVLKLWTEYVQAVCASLEPTTVAMLKKGVIGRAEKVAAASGGIFGMGNKISATEKAQLEQLSKAFAPPATTP